MIRTPNTLDPTNPGEFEADSTVTPKSLASSIQSYFRHNWTDAVTVRTEWRTLLRASALRDKEQRIGAWARPRTTVSSLHQALDQGQLRRLLQHSHDLAPRFSIPTNSPQTLLQGSDKFWAGAIHSDVAEITNVVVQAGGQFKLFANLTSGYRYYTGGRVWIVNRNFEDMPVQSGVSAPAILHDLVSPTNNDSGAFRGAVTVDPIGSFVPEPGMLIVPAIDCTPVLTVEGSNETSHTPVINIEAVEVVGDNQLLPCSSLLPDDTNVSGLFEYYQGYPIFDPDHNYREEQAWGFERDGQSFNLGVSDQVVLDGEFSRATSSFLISAERDVFWRFKILFDSRRGSLLPFWVVTGNLLMDNLSHGGGTTIPLLTDSSVQFGTTLAFKPVAGGTAIIRTASVAVGDSEITLNESLDAGDYHVHLAYLGRFTEDFIDEEWIKHDYAECRFETIELSADEVQELNP